MSTKVAVVTGSNKGIGYAIVKGLCEKFDGEVYLASRDEGRGKAAVKELEKLGLKPKFHQLEITDEVSIKNFHDYLKNTYGGIDVLVNNAAIAFKHDAKEPFAVQAEETVRVNYFGTLKVCEGLFDLLRPHARVVNISSLCGHLAKIPGEKIRERFSDPNLTVVQLSTLMKEFVESAKNGKNSEDGWGNSAYIVSKVGVSALTIIQQREINKDASKPGVSINSVHPGYVDTDMTSHKGPLTIEQGADAPIFLALLPKDDEKHKGAYIWRDRSVVDWFGPTLPAPY